MLEQQGKRRAGKDTTNIANHQSFSEERARSAFCRGCAKRKQCQETTNGADCADATS
jgi:hypothetical protein